MLQSFVSYFQEIKTSLQKEFSEVEVDSDYESLEGGQQSSPPSIFQAWSLLLPSTLPNDEAWSLLLPSALPNDEAWSMLLPSALPNHDLPSSATSQCTTSSHTSNYLDPNLQNYNFNQLCWLDSNTGSDLSKTQFVARKGPKVCPLLSIAT